MSRAPAGNASLKVNALRALAVLVPVAVLLFLLLGLAAAVVDRSLAIAFGDAERERGTAWFEWDGDVEASDIALYPRGRADEASAVRFDHVHVQTPGWIWILAHVLDRGLESARLDRLQITLEGVSSGAGLDPTLGQLGPVGAASASPFETEGCMQDVHWSRVALDTMGLSPGTTQLDYDFRVEEDVRLVTRITLATRGVSSIQFDRMSDLAQPAQALQLHLQPAVVRSERWSVQDSGFVSARNRFCTKKDGIDLRRFIERHVESVERLLETTGVKLDADSRIAYRRFARDGGTLTFGGEYQPSLTAAESGSMRAGADTLSRLRARIEHNGRGNDVVWTRVAPRPLQGWGQGETTYAALQREHVAEIRGEPPPTAGPGAVPAPSSQDVAPATTAIAGEAAGPDPAPVPPPPSPSAKDPDAPIPDGIVSSEPLPAAKPEVPANPSIAPIAGARRSGSTEHEDPRGAGENKEMPSRPAPASIAPPKEPTSEQSPTPAASPSIPPAPVRRRIEWEDLPRYRGHLVRIWTMHNPPRTVEILSGDADALRVTARLGGGQAEYTIQRDGFLRATLVR